MEHSLKKELLQYFAAKEDRTEQEERLYKKMQAEVNYYDITCVEVEDLENRNLNTADVDERTMERIADKMCGYYLDGGGFTNDLFDAAEACGVECEED